MLFVMHFVVRCVTCKVAAEVANVPH